MPGESARNRNPIASYEVVEADSITAVMKPCGRRTSASRKSIQSLEPAQAPTFRAVLTPLEEDRRTRFGVNEAFLIISAVLSVELESTRYKRVSSNRCVESDTSRSGSHRSSLKHGITMSNIA